MIEGWTISGYIVLNWMSLDLTEDKSTLVQVMAWCHQATSHYLSQCWPRSVLPYGVIRPQWVNSLWPGRCGCNLKLLISNSYQGHFPGKLPSSEHYKTTMMISHHWFNWWLCAVRQQAITPTNIDQVLWCQMAFLGHNELTHCGLVLPCGVWHLHKLGKHWFR